MSHTSEPWIVSPQALCITTVDGEIIATCNASPLGSKAQAGYDNAKLIAAAPDMLDALRAVLETCVGDPVGFAARQAKRKAMYGAAEAIAKATGRL